MTNDNRDSLEESASRTVLLTVMVLVLGTAAIVLVWAFRNDEVGDQDLASGTPTGMEGETSSIAGATSGLDGTAAEEGDARPGRSGSGFSQPSVKPAKDDARDGVDAHADGRVASRPRSSEDAGPGAAMPSGSAPSTPGAATSEDQAAGRQVRWGQGPTAVRREVHE